MSARPDPADGRQDGRTRDHAADDRDSAATQRDHLADDDDSGGTRRDDAAVVRDGTAERRDTAADTRDAAATARDTEASRREREAPGPTSGQDRALAQQFSSADRASAAQDRQSAWADRSASASEREASGRDRGTSRTDRSSAVAQRAHAGQDRQASARDRDDASVDSLTSATVRGAGLGQLARELVRAQRLDDVLTVAFVDVDHLKAVNDSGGHAAGDRLLVRASDAFRARLRPYDLVIRYGGDEFVCVMPGVGQDDAEQRFVLVNDDLRPHGSVSVGVVTARAGESAASVVERADAALYRNRVARRRESAS